MNEDDAYFARRMSDADFESVLKEPSWDRACARAHMLGGYVWEHVRARVRELQKPWWRRLVGR